MDKKISLIPLFSVFILTMALIKVYVFYNNFNIPIKYFINISELTVLIFEDLLFIVPPLLLLYIFVDKSDSKIELSNRFKDLLHKKPKDKSKKEIVLNFIRKLLVILISGFYLLLIFGFPLYLIFFHRTYSEKIFGFTLLASIILILIFITKSKRLINSLGIDGLILTMFFVIFTFFFMLRILVEIEDVEKGKFVGTKIITEKDVYISTPDNYYIGQTSSYVFIYNRQENQSTIIPVSEIKKIELSIKK
jgi:hypothetical protein